MNKSLRRAIGLVLLVATGSARSETWYCAYSENENDKIEVRPFTVNGAALFEKIKRANKPPDFLTDFPIAPSLKTTNKAESEYDTNHYNIIDDMSGFLVAESHEFVDKANIHLKTVSIIKESGDLYVTSLDSTVKPAVVKLRKGSCTQAGMK